ncbi:MAG: hypothetical protein EON54_13590 [Alcaligenaceae bacterium]|nr:MAG: hypothetical protein EON54_13590 [Alcaligenaceae bacterium]
MRWEISQADRNYLGVSMKQALSILFFLTWMSISHAESEEAWIYELKGAGGMGCLVFVTHLSPHPIGESKRISRCLENASAIAFETDPTIPIQSLWTGFERSPAEPSLKDLAVDPARLSLALHHAGYTEREISYVKKLHPAGIYRALFYSSVFATQVALLPNIDIELAKRYKGTTIQLISLEGMLAFYRNEKKLSSETAGLYINRLCDVFLDPERLETTLKNIEEYAMTVSVLPNAESSYNRKVFFNTQILGLPLDSVEHDVGNRNRAIAGGILKTLQAHKKSVLFVGADHLGGPQSLLKAIAVMGIDSELLQY